MVSLLFHVKMQKPCCSVKDDFDRMASIYAGVRVFRIKAVLRELPVNFHYNADYILSAPPIWN